MKNILSFHAFLRRGTVLTQYKDLLTIIKRFPVAEQLDMRRQIRDEFKKYKDLDDTQSIQMRITEGKK